MPNSSLSLGIQGPVFEAFLYRVARIQTIDILELHPLGLCFICVIFEFFKSFGHNRLGVAYLISNDHCLELQSLRLINLQTFKYLFEQITAILLTGHEIYL